MSSPGRGTTAIVLWMALFVVLGAPFVFLIWEFVNHILTGTFVAREAFLALVGIIGLGAVLAFVARRVMRWETEPVDRGHAGGR